jgi:predicted nucleic acid-binding protein
MSIIYLDTSALLKLYIQEKQSDDVYRLINSSENTGTSIITYTEMAAAMSKAVRMRLISEDEAKETWNKFSREWPELNRLRISSQMTERAAALAWQFGLRGYDAIHLAAALTWQETLEMPVSLATFDRLLWSAGQQAGIAVWPAS